MLRFVITFLNCVLVTLLGSGGGALRFGKNAEGLGRFGKNAEGLGRFGQNADGLSKFGQNVEKILCI